MPQNFAGAPRRYDAIGLLRAFRRHDGAILAEGVATREGVLLYPQPDGTTRRELVTREAVMDTARTLPRSSLTLEHPPDFVGAENVGEFGAGDVDGQAEVEEDQQGSFVRVRVAIRRADAVAAWDRGVHEVSAGYEVILDETAGEHPVFGRFDARQIGRRCNHLALTERGRAGHTVALRHDAADAAGYYDPIIPRRNMNPKLIRLLASLGVRVDSEDEALPAALVAVEALRADAQKYSDEYVQEVEKAKTDAEAACKDMAGKLEELQGQVDALMAEKAKGEAAEADRADAAELVRVQGLAAKVGIKHEGLALPALRLAVARSRVDSVTDETPRERLDGILLVIDAEKATRADAYRFEAEGKGKGTLPADPRQDSHFNPYIHAADLARAGGDE